MTPKNRVIWSEDTKVRFFNNNALATLGKSTEYAAFFYINGIIL